jgi:DNA-directed RNA polymerase subunit RPC12/RpoP
MIYYKCSWCSDDIERSVGGASEGYHAEYCSTKCLVEAQSAGKENKNPDRSLIEANERALERHVELYTAEVKRRDLAREKRQRKDKWIFFRAIACCLLLILILSATVFMVTDGYGWMAVVGGAIACLILPHCFFQYEGEKQPGGCVTMIVFIVLLIYISRSKHTTFSFIFGP